MLHPIWPPTRYITARWPRLALALFLVFGALAALPVAPASAATRTVTNGNDSGTGSLRDTIGAAQSGDTITFATGVSTVRITGAALGIRNLTIQGRGTGGVRIERSAGSGGIFTAYGTTTLSGLTIAKGNASTTGGGILNIERMTLTSSVITGNTANTGGGIFNVGTMTIQNSTIGNNTATALGGGINNSGTLTVTNSTVNSNSAPIGGGIYNDGTLTVNTSTISGNNSTSTSYIGGGGIYNDYERSATVTNSTISGNAAERGGGIWSGGTLTVNTSTISGNTARDIAGGIYTVTAAALTNVTITGNTNQYQAGIADAGTDSRTTMKNTVVAGNNGPNCALNASSVDGGGNVDDSNTCKFVGATSSSNAPAPLAPLGNYGGTTQTAPLLPGNPALDRASGCPATDQRGVARTLGAGCDSGAYESRGFIISSVSGSGQSGPARAAFGAPLVVTVRSNFGEQVQGGVVPFTGPTSGAGIQRTVATIGADGQASATVTANDTAGGPYTVTASAGSAGSTATFSLTNTRAMPTLTVEQLTDLGGTPFFQATLSIAGQRLEGRTITFTLNGRAIGSDATNVSGLAAVVFSFDGVAGGTYPTGVGAAFAGDASLVGASATNVLTIPKTSQTITFAQPPDKAATDAPFTVAATASSGLAVSFAASGVCTVAGNTVTLTRAVGNCTIVARQAGNGQWAAAPDVSRTFAVGKASQAITFAQPTGRTFGAAPFTVTATASSGLAIAFATTTPAICTVGAPTTATSATVTLLAAGNCAITANQPGNATYAAAPQLSRTFAVGKANQTISFGTPAGSPDYAINDTFTVAASATSSFAATFAASGACTIAGTTVTATDVGTCTVTASQAGNGNYNAAPVVARTFTVTRRSQAITFATPTGDPAFTAGDTFTVGATASSGLAVSFAASGPCTVAGTTVTTTSAGECVITASQAGDTTYAAAPEAPRTFTVGQVAQMITFGTPVGSPSYTLGDTFAVGATASSGLPVTFAVSGSCTLAGTTVTATGAGGCTVTASQGGDATYAAAPDVARTFTIVTATPSSSPSGSPVPSASPSPSGAPAPAPTFADVPADYWAGSPIAQFAQRGITTGCGVDDAGNRLFCPERGVTRAEMATFLTRALGQDKIAPPVTPTFADVPADYWAYGAIEAFAKLGITTGCGLNDAGQRLFCPDRGVTRAEMAAFLDRAKGQAELKPGAPTFADVPPGYWAYGWVERFLALGVTTGCGTDDQGNRLYCPDRGVTRAEMAVFIIRAYP